MDLEASIAAVREALLPDERISAAIVFGSAAKGLARAQSDLDVALVARAPEAARGLEADYLELAARLTLAAGREVHLVLLEGVEPVLGRQVFAHGRTLFERDPKRSADLLERITLEYFDGAYHRRMQWEALQRRREVRRG